jgi:hypothetical protein
MIDSTGNEVRSELPPEDQQILVRFFEEFEHTSEEDAKNHRVRNGRKH